VKEEKEQNDLLMTAVPLMELFETRAH
jgi:hypothetical protein